MINFSNTRYRSRVCLFLTTENEQLFIIKTMIGKLWVEVIIFTLLDAIATVDVLAASSNDVNFFETHRNLNRTFCMTIKSSFRV